MSQTLNAFVAPLVNELQALEDRAFQKVPEIFDHVLDVIDCTCALVNEANVELDNLFSIEAPRLSKVFNEMFDEELDVELLVDEVAFNDNHDCS